MLKQNIGLPACCGGHDDALRLFETRIVVVVVVDVVVVVVDVDVVVVVVDVNVVVEFNGLRSYSCVSYQIYTHNYLPQ